MTGIDWVGLGMLVLLTLAITGGLLWFVHYLDRP